MSEADRIVGMIQNISNRRDINEAQCNQTNAINAIIHRAEVAEKQRDDYKFQMEANERSWHKAENLWDAAEEKVKELSERIRELEEALGAPLAMVQAQANDKAIWLQAKTVPEACLQRELRRLHFAIESNAKYVSGQASHAPQCKNNGVRGFECSPRCKRVPEDIDGCKGD